MEGTKCSEQEEDIEEGVWVCCEEQRVCAHSPLLLTHCACPLSLRPAFKWGYPQCVQGTWLLQGVLLQEGEFVWMVVFVLVWCCVRWKGAEAR